MPLSGGQTAQGYTRSHNTSPSRYNNSWIKSVYQAACHWCHQTIDDDGKGKHQGRIASSPTEFLHDGWIKNREGIPDAIAEHYGDKGYA